MKLVDFEGEYYNCPFLNATAIKAGAISPKHLFEVLQNRKEPTAAMKRGTLQHSFVLSEQEPIMIVCDLDLRTKAGKDFITNNAAHKDLIVKSAELAELRRCRDEVRENSIIRSNMLFAGMQAEKEIYWQEDNGLLCKAKLDGLTANSIIEYKTTSNLEGFLNSAYRLHYHLQLGWYQRAAMALDGIERPIYVIAQESSAPFDVAVFKVEKYMAREWFKQCLDIATEYLGYQDGRIERPGAYPELMMYELPAWANETEGSMNESEVLF